MATSEISFSIIVPTRDRFETLIHTIMALTKIDYDDYEIIVHDNFSDIDDDSFSDFILNVTSMSEKVRVIRTKERLSMSTNFEEALLCAKNDFVCMIGDDDCLTINSLKIASEIIRATGVEAVASARVTYVWPGEKSISAGTFSYNSKHYEIRSSKKWLAFSMLGLSSYNFDLPCLYHGFVAKILIDRMRNESGSIFGSITPDAYSSIALCHEVATFAYSYRPLVVAGASRYSNGASQLGSTSGQEELKFRLENDIPIAKNWVYCKSFRAIFIEAIAKYYEIHTDANYTFMRYFNEKNIIKLLKREGVVISFEFSKNIEHFSSLSEVNYASNCEQIFLKFNFYLNRFRSVFYMHWFVRKISFSSDELRDVDNIDQFLTFLSKANKTRDLV